MRKDKLGSGGYTLIELVISLTVFAIIILSSFTLFTALVNSTVVAKRKAVASSIATNEMETIKSLPYDSLAIAGGSIYSTNPLPATNTQKINGVSYTVTKSINYVDDAFDGCANYPSQELKEKYCRNYPAPAGAPNPDTNPQDYKIVHINVKDSSGLKLADVDTQISARVSETASATGALCVKVIDSNGNPISGASISVTNSTVTPNVNVADSSDTNGVAVFYGLPPDTNNFDFKITASKSGYSTLFTIPPVGTLQPIYPNQKILTQQSSYVTLTIKPQTANSLIIETTNTSGTPLSNVKVYAKGGYKKYNLSTNTEYYFDNLTGGDTRPTTDGSGLTSISNLVPGSYIFCGDLGATSCTISGTTYYLAAAIPYGGTNPFNPITIPNYDAASQAETYPYGANNFQQKVRLMLTTSSTFPRLFSITPYEASLSGGSIGNYTFTVSGANLPCSSTASSCGTSVKFVQGSSTYTASCTGTSAGVQLSCTVNLTGATQGNTHMVVTANGNTLTIPATPPLGGIVVSP